MRRTRSTGGLAGLATVALAAGGMLLLDASAARADTPDPSSNPPAADVAAPVFTTPPLLPSALRGVSYATWIAADAEPEVTFAVTGGALPVGLSLSSDGLLSGTPATVDDATFTVTATSTDGETEATAEREFTLVVTPQLPVFITAELPGARTGDPYEAAVVASGTPTARYALAGGALPAGLELGSNGLITGTPAAAGTAVFTVRATITDGGETSTATREYTIVVAPRPAPPAPGRPPAAPPAAGAPGGGQAPAPVDSATPGPTDSVRPPTSTPGDPTSTPVADDPRRDTGGDEDLTWLWGVAGLALAGAVATTVLLVRRLRAP